MGKFLFIPDMLTPANISTLISHSNYPYVSYACLNNNNKFIMKAGRKHYTKDIMENVMNSPDPKVLRFFPLKYNSFRNIPSVAVVLFNRFVFLS